MTSSLHPQTITLSSPPPPSGGLRYPLQLGGRLSRGLPQHRRRGLQRLLRPRPLGEVHGGGNAGHPARGAEHHGGRVGQSGLLRAAGTPPRQTYTPHKDTTRQTYSTRIMLMMHACLIFYYIYPPSTRHDITDTPTSSDPPSPPPLSLLVPSSCCSTAPVVWASPRPGALPPTGWRGTWTMWVWLPPSLPSPA